MNNYNFKNLTNEEKWEERKKFWAKNKPEDYIRFLVINDEIELIKKYESIPENSNFNYKMKDEILLTLAMEKHAYKTINYLLEKKLTIKERDIIALVKNYHEEDQQENFIEILNTIKIDQEVFNKVIKEVEDYFYNDNINAFVEYVLDLNIVIAEDLKNKMEENDNLAFIIKKHEKRKEFEKMNQQYPNKLLKKANKI